MAFKTLEEANEYKINMEKKFTDLQTAHEGLKTKLSESEKQYTESTKEIERLKIKNYELSEMVSVTNSNEHSHNEESTKDKNDSSLDDVINNFL